MDSRESLILHFSIVMRRYNTSLKTNKTNKKSPVGVPGSVINQENNYNRDFEESSFFQTIFYLIGRKFNCTRVQYGSVPFAIYHFWYLDPILRVTFLVEISSLFAGLIENSFWPSSRNFLTICKILLWWVTKRKKKSNSRVRLVFSWHLKDKNTAKDKNLVILL